jgi:hypothetical protein
LADHATGAMIGEGVILAAMSIMHGGEGGAVKVSEIENTEIDLKKQNMKEVIIDKENLIYESIPNKIISFIEDNTFSNNSKINTVEVKQNIKSIFSQRENTEIDLKKQNIIVAIKIITKNKIEDLFNILQEIDENIQIPSQLLDSYLEEEYKFEVLGKQDRYPYAKEQGEEIAESIHESIKKVFKNPEEVNAIIEDMIKWNEDQENEIYRKLKYNNTLKKLIDFSDKYTIKNKNMKEVIVDESVTNKIEFSVEENKDLNKDSDNNIEQITLPEENIYLNDSEIMKSKEEIENLFKIFEVNLDKNKKILDEYLTAKYKRKNISDKKEKNRYLLVIVKTSQSIAQLIYNKIQEKTIEQYHTHDIEFIKSKIKIKMEYIKNSNYSFDNVYNEYIRIDLRNYKKRLVSMDNQAIAKYITNYNK